MNKQLLFSLGLTEKEVKLYNATLKLKQASPATLAKIVRIKRTTAYHTARILVEKGLLREDLTKRPRIFLAASPQDIQELISREQKQFAGRAGILNKLSDELSRENADESYPVPSIHFVEEEKIRQFLYRETMKWHESTMNIFKDKVLIVSPNISSLAVVIAVPVMVDIFKSMFEIIWESEM
jgi:sugar-specific transcriptional regulator TrmB